MFVKPKVFFTEENQLHPTFWSFPHILTSWQRRFRFLFLERLIPPSYSIWGVSTCLLFFTFSATNFVRDRDLIPSQNEWVNKTASADLVPSQLDYAEVEKHLKRNLSQGQGKKNKFSKSKKCKLAGVLLGIRKMNRVSQSLVEAKRKVLHEN